ncbi:MAG TPA: N-acetyltransferase [Actinobacteria bacterium]|nr:N-acetyltransferase [Actinomycetota bacterium]
MSNSEILLKAKNGQKIEIRHLRMSDVRKAADFINATVDENLMLLRDRKVTLREEKEWIEEIFKKINRGQGIFLVAEAGKKIVGTCVLECQSYRQNHIARFGIAILTDYQGIGIGTKLTERVLEMASKIDGLEIIELGVFATNKRAIDFYRELGFKEVARIPNYFKYDDKSVDNIVMYHRL